MPLGPTDIGDFQFTALFLLICRLFLMQQKNPDIDLEHYLQGSNPIFRKFIDDGLAELEKAANDNNVADNKVLSENRYGMSKTFGKDPEYWMERLNALKVIKEHFQND